MTTCGKCDAYWTSLRFEHCTVCHRTFSGTRAGDDHRVGSYDAPMGSTTGRRCLETDELAQAGLWVTTNTQGLEIWHGRAAKDGRQHRR